ncbi:MAG: hypothetical protein IPM95_14380 [Sphingobacteriales bacterium]|nr:hypothetical protein [Sphingobacteriales bacterium]
MKNVKIIDGTIYYIKEESIYSYNTNDLFRNAVYQNTGTGKYSDWKTVVIGINAENMAEI